MQPVEKMKALRFDNSETIGLEVVTKESRAAGRKNEGTAIRQFGNDWA